MYAARWLLAIPLDLVSFLQCRLALSPLAGNARGRSGHFPLPPGVILLTSAD